MFLLVINAIYIIVIMANCIHCHRAVQYNVITIQPCHVQKVTVHAGVLLSDAIVLSRPRSPDVVQGVRATHIDFMPGVS